MSKVLKQKVRLNPCGLASSVNSRNKQGGFTLIEIAIVLVIIGLLLGGVMKGQELINTARVRSLNNSIDGITAAWFSFQDRYRGFPGDYSQASVNLPGVTTANATNAGNGLVDTNEERAFVWQHLQAAGYIIGSYTGTVVAEDAYNCNVTTCPDNGFGFGMNLSYTTQSKGAPAADAHELITGSGIPVEVIAELDRKVDDGRPLTGAMQLGANGTGWGVSDGCQRTDDDVGEVYDITESVSSNCAAVFRNF